MEYFGEIVSGVFAVLVVWVEARASKDRKRNERRALVRARESKLSMQMQEANLSLALATELAVERGETNGEMKTAKEKAKAVQAEYQAFLQELASEQATSI